MEVDRERFRTHPWTVGGVVTGAVVGVAGLVLGALALGNEEPSTTPSEDGPATAASSGRLPTSRSPSSALTPAFAEVITDEITVPFPTDVCDETTIDLDALAVKTGVTHTEVNAPLEGIDLLYVDCGITGVRKHGLRTHQAQHVGSAPGRRPSRAETCANHARTGAVAELLDESELKPAQALCVITDRGNVAYLRLGSKPAARADLTFDVAVWTKI